MMARKSRMKIILVFSICFLCGTFNYAQEEMSWKKAMEIAMEQNLGLESARIALMGSQKNIGIAAAGFIPNVMISSVYTTSKEATFSENFGVLPQYTGLVGGQVSQMIYNEQILANHAVQKYLYESEESKLELTKNNVIFMAGQAYINYLMANDLFAVQASNLELTKRNLKASEDRLEFGAANRQEVLRWRTQVFASEQKVEQQKSALIYYQTHFNNTLNLPQEQKHELQKMDILTKGFIFKSEVVRAVVNEEGKAEIVRNYLSELGLYQSPLISVSDKQILALERMSKSNNRWAIPNVTFQGGVAAKWLASGEGGVETVGSEFWKYGIALNWNVFDGGKSLKKAKQTQLHLESARLERLNALSSLEQGIRSITAILIKDFINVDLALKQLEAAEDNYTLVYENYLLGDSPLINLIDAQEQKLAAEIQSKTVYYTFLLDLLQLEQAIGYYPFFHMDLSEAELVQNLETLLLIK